MQTRLTLLPAIPAPPRSRGGSIARFAALELVIWATVYGAYLAVRGFAMGAPAAARAHARDVVDVEKALGIFHEAGFQHRLAPVLDAFSTYYMLGFGPVIATMAVWLGLRRPGLYREFRNALLVSVALATIVFVFFPTAPPRLVPGLGISDTVGLSGHDTGSFMGIRFNPYAAVPSMHVGWSLLVAIYGFKAVRRRWLRALFAIHPVLMAATVTATGNHYFFDSIGGVTVASVTLLLLWPLRRRDHGPRLRVLEGGGAPEPVETLAADERRAA